MSKFRILTALLVSFFFYGLFLSHRNIKVIEDRLDPVLTSPFFEYRGAINIHSKKGMGTGDLSSIIKAAQGVGLDFIFMTELNYFDSITPEGYYRQTLVLHGDKLSYLDSRVVLIRRDLNRHFENLGAAQTYIADLLSRSQKEIVDNLLILAHPYKPGYKWRGRPEQLTGLELINPRSIWQQAWRENKFDFFQGFFVYPFNPHLAFSKLYSSPKREARFWNEMMKDASAGDFPKLALAGVEAKARTGPALSNYLRFPSYRTSFELVTNRLWLKSELIGDVESDRQKIFDTLSRGQFYICMDLLGDCQGFLLFLKDASGREWLSGEKHYWEDGIEIRYSLPGELRGEYQVLLYRNNIPYKVLREKEGQFQLSKPGIYRVEVQILAPGVFFFRNHWLPWIFSNAFKIIIK